MTGIRVDNQFTIVGAYGALTVFTLSGLLLHRLLPHGAAGAEHPADTDITPTA